MNEMSRTMATFYNHQIKLQAYGHVHKKISEAKLRKRKQGSRKTCPEIQHSFDDLTSFTFRLTLIF